MRKVRGLPLLEDWWASGQGRSSWTIFENKTGMIEVYVRRNIVGRGVMDIANVRGIKGFGCVRPLYRTFCADIPTIAENILNPELDALLIRWGWDWAYVDQIDTPTRVNKAFQSAFPAYREAGSPIAAVLIERKLETEKC